MRKKFEKEEEYLSTQSWNTREKKSHTFLYVLIGILSFLIAWVMT